jgi:ADP-heptose:LPS heptosyltransferase
MLTKRFHHVICTEQLFGLAGHLSNFLTSKNGRLIGFDTCKSSDLFTTKVEFVEDLHETENFNNLVKVVMNKETKLKSATRTTMSRTPSYEVIILGGSDSESRSLTIEDWIYLVKQYGGQFSLFKIVAAPQDQELAKSLASRINADEISNSFESAISLVSGSKSVLTVDSGFVHIASYFGVPAKVLFTSGNPKKWSPLSSGSIVLQNGFSCQPCGKFGQVPPCNFSFRCKSNLSSLELTKVIH